MRKLMFLLALVWVMTISASAHEVPDLNRKGVITVTIRSGKNTVAGGEMTIYRVGDIHEDDGNYSFVLSKDLADCGISLENPETAQTAAKFAGYIAEEKIKGNTQKVGKNGVAAFYDLEPGLYLLIQSEAAKGYNPAEPFLVSMPMLVGESYSYRVDAGPKISPVERVDPPNPEQPKTGQSSLPIWMFSLSAAGLLILRRRKWEQ